MISPYSLFRVPVLICTLILASCAQISVPIFKEKEKAENLTSGATPRELLGAKLANPRTNENVPSMTIGKLIEYADRYLACDCADTRFVRAWEKTTGGYRLLTNSPIVKPLDFSCHASTDSLECFLEEIDRGSNAENLQDRFVSGSEFINFLYENGVRCDGKGQCP